PIVTIVGTAWASNRSAPHRRASRVAYGSACSAKAEPSRGTRIRSVMVLSLSLGRPAAGYAPELTFNLFRSQPNGVIGGLGGFATDEMPAEVAQADTQPRADPMAARIPGQ